jgi:DUF4097 and DUF4098 domain-containing protein YvlB
MVRSAFFALATAALVTGGCIDLVGADVGRYTDREEKRFSVEGRPVVSVSTFDGSIEVRPWDRPEVAVVIEKRAANKRSADTIEVEAKQDGNRISVDVHGAPHHGFSFNMSRSAKLVVSLPAAADLTAKSGDGAIDVDGIAGKIDLHSGDGSIKARALEGDVVVTTGDGSVTLDGKFASLRARSGDGSLRIVAASGSTASNDWDISSGDGSVTFELPNGFNAELDAHTGDGSIRLDGLSVSNVNGEIRRNTVRGRLGSGGATLRVHTGDGSITLRSARPSGTGDSR